MTRENQLLTVLVVDDEALLRRGVCQAIVS
jgi:hypothetical protein